MKLFKKAKLVLIITGAVIIALVFSYGWFSVCYAKKIYSGVKIGELNFSGLNRNQAKKLFEEKKDEIQDSKVIFRHKDQEYKISSNDLDLEYDSDKTVNLLYQKGRDQGFWQNIATRIKLAFTGQSLLANYQINKDKLNLFLAPIISEIEIPVIDSSFEYKNGKIEITPDQTGQEISRFKISQDFESVIGNLFQNNQINLVAEKKNPKITQIQVEQLMDSIQKIIKDKIKLKSEVKNIDITQEQIANWIDLSAQYQNNQTARQKTINRVYAVENFYEPQIKINQDKIKTFAENIAKDVNREPQDAKLTVLNGQVSVFRIGEKGYKLDIDKSVKKIASLLLTRLKVAGINSQDAQNESNEIELPITIKDPEVNNQNINELGLKELIASGTTNFYNSPKNRVANIKRGAELFNGVLIKPGDTLSAISVIGNPSASTGFLPELVILENKTTPEYGGGLCQVSTTLFRAALNAGLEIPERTNHSYRVSYYEPPVGMDATVYYPTPDLKIRNNTLAYILIQTHIDGTKITFDLYGTKDGRKVEISEPTLYDVTSPPEPQYVESSNLAPGEIKKLESAHNGGKADFHYKVTLSDKVIIDQNFHSTYKAWQAKYLYGPGTTIPGQGETQPQPTETTTTPSPEPTPASSSDPVSTTSSPTPTETTTSTPTSAPTTTSPSPSPTT